MPNVRQDHTMEFPTPIKSKKTNIVVRVILAIRSGFIYSGDR